MVAITPLGVAGVAIGLGKCLLGPLWQECCYLIDYKDNVNDLRDKVKILSGRKNDIETIIKAAEFDNAATKSEVEKWLKRASDGLEKYNRKEGTVADITGCCRPCWVPRYWRGRKVVKRAAKIRSIIEDAAESGKNIFVPVPIPASVMIRTESSSNIQQLSSTEEVFRDVMEALKGKEAFVIGIHGMGGVGKTTMAKRVMEKVLEDKLFAYTMMVTVSQTVDVRNIQGQIADKLGIDMRNCETESGRADKLKNGIMKGKKVLIVVDDVWEELKLESIGIPDLQSCESKILLTARGKNVCGKMRCNKEIHLKPLTKGDSWSLMKTTTGLAFRDPDFESVGISVTRECGGLPLAIVAVGMALKAEDRSGWEQALQWLKRSAPAIQPENIMEVYNSIKLSYDFLKSDVIKEYFRLCCLFPEDHNIDKEELARYGMGLGWFPEANSMEEARDHCNTTAKSLVSSGLLLEGDEDGRVKMHDVVRDVAIQMTLLENKSGERIYMAQAGRGLENWPMRRDYGSYDAISVMYNSIKSLPEPFECPKLRVLLLQENNNIEGIPSSFFQSMKSLTVLSLSNIRVHSLPNSLRFPPNLQILLLDRWVGKDVSFIGNLKKLEIICIKESNIEELPENIGNLSSLRILDLSGCNKIKKIPKKVISRLSGLEELYLQGSFSNWEKEGTNACFRDLINLPRLTSLKVDIMDPGCMPQELSPPPNWKEFHICICKDEVGRLENAHLTKSRTDARNLVLDCTVKNLPKWFIRLVTSKVEWLMYRGGKNRNFVEEHDTGELSRLKFLVVELCRGEKQLMNIENRSQSGPVFENLQELRIHCIKAMEEICAGELPGGSLKKLKFVEVQQCNHLVNSLLPSNLIKRLSNLEKLSVKGNRSVTEIFGFGGLEDGSFYLEELREIRLDNLANLQSLWKDSAAFVRFSKLKCLIVTKCNKLSNLFSVSEAEGLTELEDLWIEDCSIMNDIIYAGDITTTLTFPKLKTLTLQNLVKLSNFYSGGLECMLLEHVYVKNCSTFQYKSSGLRTSEIVQENDEQHMILLRKRYKDYFE